MQDIPSDDFSILNGGDAGSPSADKDMYPTLIYKVQNTSPSSPPIKSFTKPAHNENNESTSFVPVKLDEINTIELFPSNSANWQHYQLHDLVDHRSFLDSQNSLERSGANLLLQGSDDPLISHGANSMLFNDDEHPADFDSNLLMPIKNNYKMTGKQENQRELQKLSKQQKTTERLVKTGCSNLTRQQLKAKANLMSARNQQKVNTLPNAATEHVASSQSNKRVQKLKAKKCTAFKLRFHHQALPPEYLSHYEATQGQLKPLSNIKAANQRTVTKATSGGQKQSQHRNSHENVRSWLKKIAEIQRTANASKEKAHICVQKDQHKQNTGEAWESPNKLNPVPIDANNNYRMSNRFEDTKLNSSTDDAINASIKSTNTSLYSDLPFMGEITLNNFKPRRGRKPKKADICHLIYKNYGTILPNKNKTDNYSDSSTGVLKVKSQRLMQQTNDKPLNLCLRDQLTDSYSISSGDEMSETNSSCPTPISHAIDHAHDSMLANKLKASLKDINEQVWVEKTKALSTPNKCLSTQEEHVRHPVNVSCKKLLESGAFLHDSCGPYKTIKKDNQLALKIPIPSNFFLPQKIEKSLPTSVVLPKTAALQIENASTTIANLQLIAPQKRKRSAIFIPPMNVENTNNPATEVSICKFKFTGGSKPSLQEKKMISVDAGGNYRYFSGTGDKASRGYEYFPRETLQHTAGLLPGVNCTGQKLSMDMPSASSVLDNDLLNISETSSPTAMRSGRAFNLNRDSSQLSLNSTPLEVSKNEACSLTKRENSTFPSSSLITSLKTPCAETHKNNADLQQVKKLNKSEKLSQTFKEQGFLIQTQQLESAEGATYCKFRQLKKFTRYLFRNWKDHLPNSSSCMAELASSAKTREPPQTN